MHLTIIKYVLWCLHNFCVRFFAPTKYSFFLCRCRFRGFFPFFVSWSWIHFFYPAALQKDIVFFSIFCFQPSNLTTFLTVPVKKCVETTATNDEYDEILKLILMCCACWTYCVCQTMSGVEEHCFHLLFFSLFLL